MGPCDKRWTRSDRPDRGAIQNEQGKDRSIFALAFWGFPSIEFLPPQGARLSYGHYGKSLAEPAGGVPQFREAVSQTEILPPPTTGSPMTLAPGQKLAGMYILRREVAQTEEIAPIWLAYDEALGKEISLHFLPEEVRADDGAMTELRREIKRNRQLIHANILRVYELVEEDDWAAISMDWFEAESVASLLAQKDGGFFEPGDLKPWLDQLCQGLDDVHKIQLVHRNVSPANLYIDKAGKLLIANLGVSRIIEDSLARSQSGAAGERHLAFKSLQQLDGEPPTKFDDIYSVGVMLYGLLSGQAPFVAGAEGAIEPQIRRALPEPMMERRAKLGKRGGTILPVWEKAVAACLAKTIADRPQSVAELAAKLGVGGRPGAGGDAAAAATAGSLAKNVKPQSPAPTKPEVVAKKPEAPAAAPAPGYAAAPAKTFSEIAAAVAADEHEAEYQDDALFEEEKAAERMLLEADRPAAAYPGLHPRKSNYSVAVVISAIAILAIAACFFFLRKPKLETVLKIRPPAPANLAQKAPPAPMPPTPVVQTPQAPKESPSSNGAGNVASTKSDPLGQPDVSPNEAPGSPADAAPLAETPKADGKAPGEATPPVSPADKPSTPNPIPPVVASASSAQLPAPSLRATVPGPVPTAGEHPKTPGVEAPAVAAPVPSTMVENAPIASGPTPAPAAPTASPPPSPVLATPAPAPAPAAGGPAPVAGKIPPAPPLVEASAPVEKVRQAASAAEKRALELHKQHQSSDASVAEARKALAEKRKSAVPTMEAGKDLQAQRDRKEDLMKAAALAAQQARQVAEEKARAAEEARKALTDWEAQNSSKLAARDRVDSEVMDYQRSLDDRLAATAALAKAVTDADAANKLQAAALLKAEELEKTRAQEARKAEAAKAEKRAQLDKEMKALAEKLKALQDQQKQFGTEGEAPAGSQASPSPASPPAASAQAPSVPAPAQAEGETTRRPEGAKEADALVVFENSLGMKFAAVGDVLFCVWPTRVKDFAAFARETPVSSDRWRNPDFKQGPDHPVVWISWYDAAEFCKWLTDREHKSGVLPAGQIYRLPTDLEWSKGVGLSSEPGRTPAERDLRVKDIYPWGTQWPPPQNAGNYTGEETGSEAAIQGYNDGYSFTSPAGSFPPNKYGLYDMGGNVWQWCMDNWNGNTAKPEKVLRGGSWYNGLKLSLLSSCRSRLAPEKGQDASGFRIVRAAEGAAHGKQR